MTGSKATHWVRWIMLYVLFGATTALSATETLLFAAAPSDPSSIDDVTLQQILNGALHHEQTDAMYMLAMLKFYGQRVDQDTVGAVRLLQKLAQRGHGDAEFALGVLYGSGGPDTHVLPHSDRTSASWLASSANRGHAEAKWMLATMYNEGRGVPQDTQRALELLVDAVAQHHNPRAMFHLGTMYEYGRGVERDHKKAAQLYQQASDLHVLDATYYLALLYGSGRGVPKDTPRALLLLNKAVDNGHAPAMLRLGEMNADGEGGLLVDYGSALLFFRRASTTSDLRVSEAAKKRVLELEWVLSQADALVQVQERTLGVPLRVQVGSIESL